MILLRATCLTSRSTWLFWNICSKQTHWTWTKHEKLFSTWSRVSALWQIHNSQNRAKARKEGLCSCCFCFCPVLMRQYAYMGEDGSYKMFRRDSEACLWWAKRKVESCFAPTFFSPLIYISKNLSLIDCRVTAFVGQVLHDCLASEWGEDVYISVDIVNKITDWITEQQNKTTGHFQDTTPIEYYRTLQDVSHAHFEETLPG